MSESVFNNLPPGICLHDNTLTICEECHEEEISRLKSELTAKEADGAAMRTFLEKMKSTNKPNFNCMIR